MKPFLIACVCLASFIAIQRNGNACFRRRQRNFQAQPAQLRKGLDIVQTLSALGITHFEPCYVISLLGSAYICQSRYCPNVYLRLDFYLYNDGRKLESWKSIPKDSMYHLAPLSRNWPQSQMRHDRDLLEQLKAIDEIAM